jgi:thiamine biosynthesis protein ThiI|tara:strand:- start:266 stop:1447 length:1182 start_codon:yes stop_codon:yes gene_type:complete
MQSIVVHYQELALKGKNRPWFIARLVRNLKEATADLNVISVRALPGRIEMVLGVETKWPLVRERVTRIFGVANFGLARRVTGDLDAVASSILDDLGDTQTSSFRVKTRRTDKRYPLTSPQIDREIGGRIKTVKGWPVNLSLPDLTIYVEMLTDSTFYYFDKIPGSGGLPSGVSGRVLCLQSGGIDSPVAAYRMMKRGCRVQFIHFHSYPILSKASQDKVREIVMLLTKHQLHSRLFMVAFGDIQRQVVLRVPPPLRVVVYRRLMLRIADHFARQQKAKALVTGEALGQVASQTLDNISTINAVTNLPIFRPLIGLDKEEITVEARKIETYPISIIPDQDCCQLFIPKHPSTKAKLQAVQEAESGLPVDDLVHQAVSEVVREDMTFPGQSQVAD